MKNLSDVVLEVVNKFIDDNELFTALDVSNKVKEELPFARHREVRDEVRKLFTSVIEPNGYTHTPISVSLQDGSKADALLYHPVSDAWDLDAKYNAQQRNQVAVRPGQASTVPTPIPNINVISNLPPTSPAVIPPSTTVAATSNSQSIRDLWKNLFNLKPSLFPRK